LIVNWFNHYIILEISYYSEFFAVNCLIMTLELNRDSKQLIYG
jgi:hypothetical protein